MKASKKIMLLASCLIGIANNADAYYIGRLPDGSVYISGCKEKTIGKTNYICCDDNCQTRDYWIKREYRTGKDVNYMADLAEIESVDHHITMSDEKIEFDEVEDDQTPTLGKIQNKLDELSSNVFGLIGL